MRLLLPFALVAMTAAWECRAEVDPSSRTADMPDSWLVLYNSNDPESIQWAEWYQAQRAIPTEHMLGLTASLSEHLSSRSAANAQIINPVKDYFAAQPEIEAKVMGIILGHGLPSHFGQPPLIPDVGGYSIANALQDLTNEVVWEVNWQNPHMIPPYGSLPAEGRLTKATLLPGHYMVCQIQAGSLFAAQTITVRAKAIESDPLVFSDETYVWFDYYDSALPGGEWYWLRHAVEAEILADAPWEEFDDDTDQTPDDSFRFGTHDVSGWDDPRLFGEPSGHRILAFNFNSWGATTVRSCTAEGGRYVPNALAASYASAIGSTGEPQCCLCPFPDTLLAALKEGWTLGEAFYLANPYDDWMWTIVGDPFLSLRLWFGEAGSPDFGDITADDWVDLRDFGGMQACLGGPEVDAPRVCRVLDSDDDRDCDLADFAVFQHNFRGGDFPPRDGDYDQNGAVDFSDFKGLWQCIGGPGPVVLKPDCHQLDFEFDLDVDLRDFTAFQCEIE